MTTRIGIACLLALLVMGTTASADPSFVYLGNTETSPGVFDHSYKISNIGGTVPLYDLETTWEYYGAWFSVNGPDDWNLTCLGFANYRFDTQAAPCNYEKELYGFHIYAATPNVQAGNWTVTDGNHMVVNSGMADYPIPEPASLSLLALGGLAALRRRK